MKYGVRLYLPFLLFLAGCSIHHTIIDTADGVVLLLEHPFAETVYFASSVDDFRLRPALREGKGRWKVDGLRNEEFFYFYVVDGKPYVPECRYRQQDDFGTTNCIYQP